MRSRAGDQVGQKGYFLRKGEGLLKGFKRGSTKIRSAFREGDHDGDDGLKPDCQPFSPLLW